MKNKIFTGIMGILMAASMPITAFAADTQSFNTDGNAAIPVSCQIKSEYTVSLPAAFTLSVYRLLPSVKDEEGFQ